MVNGQKRWHKASLTGRCRLTTAAVRPAPGDDEYRGGALPPGRDPQAALSRRAGARAKLLQQIDGMDQVERVKHIVREISLLPGPGDANVPQRPHRDATLGGEGPAHVVQQGPAGGGDGLCDLHCSVLLPLGEVLAQIPRQTLRWFRMLERLCIDEAEPFRRRQLAHGPYVFACPGSFDGRLDSEHEVEMPDVAPLELPLVQQQPAFAVVAKATDSAVGPLLADAVQLAPPRARVPVPRLRSPLDDTT